jgi:hypothetical protein
MTLLFDIVFQSGDFYNQDQGWLSDFLNTIIGTVIGSAVTVLTLYLTFRYDKIKDEKKQIQFQKEKIKYLQSLVRSILIDLKSQIGYYKSYGEEIANNPVNLPLLKLVSLIELERVVHKINQEDYYHAYLGEFGDNQEIVDEFRSIISNLNYFDEGIKMDKTSLEESMKFDYQRKIKLKSILEKLKDDISSVLINRDIKQHEFQFWEFLNKSMNDFDTKRSEQSDVKFWHENFIQIIKPRLPEFADRISKAQELLFQMKDATYIYTEIQTLNKLVAAEFIKSHTEKLKVYNKLESQTKQLMNF